MLRLEPDASEVSRNVAGRKMCTIRGLLSRALDVYATLVVIPYSEDERRLVVRRNGLKEREWEISRRSIKAPIKKDFVASGELPRTFAISGSTLGQMRLMARIGGGSVASVAQQSLALYRQLLLAGSGSTLHLDDQQISQYPFTKIRY